MYFAGSNEFLKGEVTSSQGDPSFKFTSFLFETYNPKFSKIYLPNLRVGKNILVVCASDPIADVFKGKAEKKGYEVINNRLSPKKIYK